MDLMRVGAVVFEHTPDFVGEVEIRRGEKSMLVPISALRALVADSIRQDMLRNVRDMKHDQLFKRLG